MNITLHEPSTMASQRAHCSRAATHKYSAPTSTRATIDAASG